jgi:hypothetical protein
MQDCLEVDWPVRPHLVSNRREGIMTTRYAYLQGGGTLRLLAAAFDSLNAKLPRGA